MQSGLSETRVFGDRERYWLKSDWRAQVRRTNVAFSKTVEADRRTIVQNAKLAIRDIFDVIVELVTNAIARG